MTSLGIGWRFAAQPDREALSRFVCAVPEKPFKSAATGWKPVHPRFWEYDAQRIIRGLRPPLGSGRHVLIGEDSEGLAAVSSWAELEAPNFVHLDVMGIAPRYRRQGGEVAREMFRETMTRIEQVAIEANSEELYVEGEIYKENDASLQMVDDMGFVFFDEAVTGAQTWNFQIYLSEAYEAE